MKYAVVVIGYNRKKSLERLLSSLIKANYPQAVDLVISLDKGDNHQEMRSIADNFVWPFGDKVVRQFSERQGLKKHVLACGDLTSDYDAIVALEDDIVVSPFFFDYVISCVNKYNGNYKISGISLYSPAVNPYCMRSFSPANNGCDVFLMQVAQSWGQCWTKEMWSRFREWYKNNSNELQDDGLIPRQVQNWGQKSWLKYYMRYVVDSNTYFVYPYISLTTNCSDEGEHNRNHSSRLQVPILEGKHYYNNLPEIDEAIKYDAFYERQFPAEMLRFFDKDVIIDFYGQKYAFPQNGYLVSTQKLNYKVENKIGLVFRPQENCLIAMSTGNGVCIYNLGSPSSKKPTMSRNEITEYFAYGLHWKEMMQYSIKELVTAITNRVKRVFQIRHR